MNIFFVDDDPIIAAQSLYDKHVLKMVIETGQLLSAAHHIMGEHRYPEIYKLTHRNHPCTRWVCTNTANYDWLYEHFLGLLDEYTFRYNKNHASSFLKKYINHQPTYLTQSSTISTPALAMPDEYKRKTVVESYREYYCKVKTKLKSFKYTRRNPPSWLVF